MSFYLIHAYYSGEGGNYWVLEGEQARVPECKGLKILLNRGATMADAAGISLCIGILK